MLQHENFFLLLCLILLPFVLCARQIKKKRALWGRMKHHYTHFPTTVWEMCVVVYVCDPLWRFFLCMCVRVCAPFFFSVCVLCVFACFLGSKHFPPPHGEKRARALHAHTIQKTQNKTQKRRKAARLCVAALRKLCVVPLSCCVFTEERYVCVCMHALCLSSRLLSCTMCMFTDLSVAGLPAELKHITQRRKRKQP